MLNYPIYHICQGHIQNDDNKLYELYYNILVVINISKDYKWNRNTKQ